MRYFAGTEYMNVATIHCEGRSLPCQDSESLLTRVLHASCLLLFSILLLLATVALGLLFYCLLLLDLHYVTLLTLGVAVSASVDLLSI